MAHSAKSLAALKQRRLLDSSALRRVVTFYMARTGLSGSEFSRRIGYSAVTMSLWLNGKYKNVADSDRMIRARITDYIDAHPVAADDDLEGELYETENFRRLRDDFYLALDRARIVVRHGNPGTQKSFGVRCLIAQLNRAEATPCGFRRAYRVYAREAISPAQLLRRVAVASGVPNGTTIDATISNLRHDFTGRRGLIVIDEAQHLSEACLETLRELNDEPPHFGLLLLGSHDLKKKFEGFRMEQWRSRLHILDSLPGISRDEGRKIVCQELPWLDKSKVEQFLDAATVADEGALVKEALAHNLDKAVTYISARDLFWNIRQTKDESQRRTRTA